MDTNEDPQPRKYKYDLRVGGYYGLPCTHQMLRALLRFNSYPLERTRIIITSRDQGSQRRSNPWKGSHIVPDVQFASPDPCSCNARSFHLCRFALGETPNPTYHKQLGNLTGVYLSVETVLVFLESCGAAVIVESRAQPSIPFAPAIMAAPSNQADSAAISFDHLCRGLFCAVPK